MNAQGKRGVLPHRGDFRFFHTLRVRGSEVDYQGIVFNSHYLTWFDITITEQLRELDFDYRALVEREGLDFHVVKASVEYHAPVHHDAMIDVGIAPGRIGTSSITWVLGVFDVGAVQPSATGEVVWVCAKPGEHRSHALPDRLVQALRTGSRQAAG